MDILESISKLLRAKYAKILKALASSMEIRSESKKEGKVKKIADFLCTPEGRIFAKSLDNYGILFSVDPKLPNSCPCGEPGGDFIECVECQKKQHIGCMYRAKSEFYICPECQLKSIHILHEFQGFLLHPCVVLSKRLLENVSTYSFKISDDTRTRIIQDKLEVEVRCISVRQETYVQRWPDFGFLLVNDKIAMEYSTNPNSSAPKRKDKPVIITTLVVNSKVNTVRIVSMNDDQAYVAAVVLVKRLTVDELTDKIVIKPAPSRNSMEILKNYMSDIDGGFIQSIKIPLTCLYSMKVIEYPVRGK